MMAAAQAIFLDMKERGILTPLVGSEEEADVHSAPVGHPAPSRSSMYDADTGEGPRGPGPLQRAGDTLQAAGKPICETQQTLVGKVSSMLPGLARRSGAAEPQKVKHRQDEDSQVMYPEEAEEGDVESQRDRGSQQRAFSESC